MKTFFHKHIGNGIFVRQGAYYREEMAATRITPITEGEAMRFLGVDARTLARMSF